MLQAEDPKVLWILSLGVVITVLLAYLKGAYEASSIFRQPLGSGITNPVLTGILSTSLVIIGAALLGHSVCDTFRAVLNQGNANPSSHKDLMLVAFASLVGSGFWNIGAEVCGLSVSPTHSLMGAILGFGIVKQNWSFFNWFTICILIYSLLSPILSAIVTSIIYLTISKTIIRKIDPLTCGLKAMPLFHGLIMFIMVSAIMIGGPNLFGLNNLSFHAGLLISLLATAAAISLGAIKFVPELRRQIMEEIMSKQIQAKQQAGFGFKREPLTHGIENAAFKPDTQLDCNNNNLSTTEIALNASQLGAREQKPQVAPKPAHLIPQAKQLEDIDLSASVDQKLGQLSVKDPNLNLVTERYRGFERLEVSRLFSSLQILSACFLLFAEGTNSMSCLLAPLIPIWNIHSSDADNMNLQTETWMLALAASINCFGQLTLGKILRGRTSYWESSKQLVRLTPSKGFSVEMGAAITMLCGAKLGLPSSMMPLCSFVMLDLVSSRLCSQDNLLDHINEDQVTEKQDIDWRLLAFTGLSWLVSVPLTALVSAITMIVADFMIS